MHHQQLAHQVIEGLAGGFPVRIGQRPGKEGMGLLALLRSHPPRVFYPPRPFDGLDWRRCQIVARVVADDLDDLDEAEGGPQPAEGRELIIIDLRHPTIMPPAWPDDRASALAVPPADSIYIRGRYMPHSAVGQPLSVALAGYA
jgi:hypothetical protein